MPRAVKTLKGTKRMGAPIRSSQLHVLEARYAKLRCKKHAFTARPPKTAQTVRCEILAAVENVGNMRFQHLLIP